MALVAQGGSDDLHNCCINRLMGRGNDNHNKGRDEVMNTEIGRYYWLAPWDLASDHLMISELRWDVLSASPVIVIGHAGDKASIVTNAEGGYSWCVMNEDLTPIHTKFRMKALEDVDKPASDPVHHPSHYTYGKIETIDFIMDKDLNFNLGNAVKYVVRSGHKGNAVQDLEKAKQYIDFEIQHLKGER